ncbi:MAG TPA: hypothetical protein VF092_11590 [Longimicrobium sp.]
MRVPGWPAIAAGGVLAGLFAFANRFERVSVSLGFVQLYAVPLSIFFFAAFLLGMAAMLLLSLPQDRRTRELLRAHGLLDAPAPAAPNRPSAPPPADPLVPRPDPRDAVDS